MKKVIIAIGLYFGLYAASFAQEVKEEDNKVKLKLEEINLVSSYYQQDGDNSAVTGGKGTEALFNIGNSLDITVSLVDRMKRKHSLNAQLNVDAYTSASSDNINPATISGASHSDVHVYPSLTYSVLNPESRITKSVSASYSTEYDYESYGLNLGVSMQSKDKNTDLGLKVGAFIDQWQVIAPFELRLPFDSKSDQFKPRNTYLASLTLSHIVNKDLQISLMAEPTYQEGLLSTPYHRVYFEDGSHTVEKLPGSRMKFPVSMRAHYFMGDKVIIKAFYRFYKDDWGMTAHTANLEVPIKINPFFSISPFYRFNRQSAVDYFKPFGGHSTAETYYTSDFDISAFDSHFAGLGFRKSTPGGVFGIQHFNALEFRIGGYYRTTGMFGGIGTLLVKLK
ncbi:Protein of unknown function [Spirosomataceae bacterium TFI 002]|nr:Protein of unknown function [Spirosomataceae bacterium TFI 002]